MIVLAIFGSDNNKSLFTLKSFVLYPPLLYFFNQKQAREYLQLFHQRYGNYKDFSDLTINSMDIGYSTLGEGIKELEERVNFVYSPWEP